MEEGLKTRQDNLPIDADVYGNASQSIIWAEYKWKKKLSTWLSSKILYFKNKSTLTH